MIRTIPEILKDYTHKKSLSPFVKEHLPKSITEIMEFLVGEEIGADHVFENDSYCYDKDRKHYDADRDYVVIATSGTGDEWVCSFDTKTIWFIDHDNFCDNGTLDGAEGVQDMEINFEEFVILADLIKKLEEIYLDDDNWQDELFNEKFKEEVPKIKKGLLEKYPYTG